MFVVFYISGYFTMDFTPFNDYFSLCDVAWKSECTELHGHLESIMGRSQPCKERDSVHGLFLDNINVDPLDELRRHAIEEFRRNGVESDLDEIDMCQHQIREIRANTDAKDNPAMACYLENKNKRKAKKFCVFCKNNGELPSLYQNHTLKDAGGRVTCPVLRKYTCPHCGQNGDNAHTIRYCPKNSGGASPGLILFLNSTRDSSGRLRVSKAHK